MSADEPRPAPAAPATTDPYPHPHPHDDPHGRAPAAGTEDTMSSPAPAPRAEDPAPLTQPVTKAQADEPTGPAVGTLAWGLVVLAVAGVLVTREVTDVTVDLSYALPVGMVALGLLLVVGAVVTGLRRRR